MLKLRELRKQRCLSQAVLAKKAGVTVFTISRLECGRHKPTALTVQKLARGLGVKPDAVVAPNETAGH